MNYASAFFSFLPRNANKAATPNRTVANRNANETAINPTTPAIAINAEAIFGFAIDIPAPTSPPTPAANANHPKPTISSAHSAPIASPTPPIASAQPPPIKPASPASIPIIKAATLMSDLLFGLSYCCIPSVVCYSSFSLGFDTPSGTPFCVIPALV